MIKRLFLLLLFTLLIVLLSCGKKEPKKTILQTMKGEKTEKHEFFFNIDTAMVYLDEAERLTVSNEEYDKLIANCHNFTNLFDLTIFGGNNYDYTRMFDSLSKLPKLEEIEMREFNSNCKLPNNIYKLKSLKVLALESKEMEYIFNVPDSIGYCPNLEILRLCNYRALPKSLDNLKKLKHIWLGYEVSVFPKILLSIPSLEKITIHGKLNDIPKDLVKLKNLKELRIDGNPIAYDEKWYFQRFKRYNKLQFIVEQMPQCKIMLDRSAK